jgi:hypothetical protein
MPEDWTEGLPGLKCTRAARACRWEGLTCSWRRAVIALPSLRTGNSTAPDNIGAVSVNTESSFLNSRGASHQRSEALHRIQAPHLR